MIDKKDMYYNFDMIIPRLVDSFNHTDFEHANRVLSSIKHNCICIGTGGSNSVSLYASIILEYVNNIIAVSKEPRDVLYMNIFSRYDHILAITYGNRNYGIDEAITKARDTSKIIDHTITMNSSYEDDICYKGEIPHEYSFISLASTIIPSSLMLNYYLNKRKNINKDKVIEIIKDIYLNANKISNDFNISDPEVFEIMTGDDTYFASHILESTITEAGLGIPVLHEKYSYCHGRSSLSYTLKNSNLIYLLNGEMTDLDEVLLDNAANYYKNIVVLKSEYEDRIIGEFDLGIKSLVLTKLIAEKESKDLSIVNYSPFVKKLYYFKGSM